MKQIQTKPKTFFRNKVVTKKYLKEILFWAFRNFGMARAGFLSDSLKKLGFYYATQGGVSISIEDLKIPPLKTEIIDRTKKQVNNSELNCIRGELTEVERYQQLTNQWNTSSEVLKNKVVYYLKNFDPLNPVYMMAFSGARGNLSQVRQLVGIRGLMSGPTGDIIDIPITTNFREGLSVTDYMISAYGARKGLVDTALKTADSGYLTRRLVDVAQDILIRETDCKTKKGILLFNFDDGSGNTFLLKDRLIGRILAKDIFDEQKRFFAYRNQQISSLLAKRIYENKFNKVLVRSPITCELSRSVCQTCYGWNLAYGKLVDLGEAVGVVAAQSIGEPGTQLTMRTFHTGGVFTAESNGQIFSKISGQIRFPANLKACTGRTEQGDKVLIVENDTKIEIVNFKNFSIPIFVKKESMLFVKKDQFIKKDQIIAILAKTKQNVEKKEKKEVFSSVGGEILLDSPFFVKSIKTFNTKTNNLDGGVFWILSGKVLNIPFYAKINKYKFENLKPHSNLATIKLITSKTGFLKLFKNNNTLTKNKEISLKILVKNLILKNSKIYKKKSSNVKFNSHFPTNFVLQTEQNKIFKLHNCLDKTLKSGSIIGEEFNNSYQTNLGGLIYHNLLNSFEIINASDDEKIDSILFLPEETIRVNRRVRKVKSGDWIEANTQISGSIYNRKAGFVEFEETGGIVSKVIIKIGSFLNIKNDCIDEKKYNNRVFFPGEKLLDEHVINQLTYTQIVKSSSGKILLLQPVFLYEFAKNQRVRKLKNFKSFSEINYRVLPNKYRIESNENKIIQLVKRKLVLAYNKNDYVGLEARVAFSEIESSKFGLECNVLENIFSEKNFPNIIGLNNIKISTLFRNNQFIESNTIIGDINIAPKKLTTIKQIKERKNLYKRKLFLVSTKDYLNIFIEQSNKINSSKKFIKFGDSITKQFLSCYSGKILSNTNKNILLHKGKPFLFSKGAEIFWKNNEFIKSDDSLGVLYYQRAQTGDIVQGLPKVEEILEARREKVFIRTPRYPGIIIAPEKIMTSAVKTRFLYISLYQKIKYCEFYPDMLINENTFIIPGKPLNTRNASPHTSLKYLNFYYKIILNFSLHEAAYRSLRKSQSYLLNSIQSVYSSQGVDISDKHLEIIVKQIGSKVRVNTIGQSNIIPGEYIYLQHINKINTVLEKTKNSHYTIDYYPVLLGITKASLVTESFISAASFQETVRVLADAAIQGKADWLRGLKENVIIGRLIPAGTGFNSYDQISNLNVQVGKKVSENKKK
jgi:DNA-directed RNA polymerase subunit beta'|uniref:DNA-directed RNA polymerase subunit beta'' n=2 Tax=Heterosigma akashiwo TaxID=2829 RepID=B2XT78_HETAK|nr:RNA polymerase beta'' subunit [Heterosigma akashiwo]ABV65976.1 DNA-directed RNA polymerase beta'' subunit [Heterosigma akashiwo]BBA18184.1 DNA-directed RNA polymerase beta'' subunit [Heterosigma akashiwo]